MIKVGVCGCGTIGSYLIKTILKQYNKYICLVGVTETNPECLKSLSNSLKKKMVNFPLKELVKNTLNRLHNLPSSACESINYVKTPYFSS